MANILNTAILMVSLTAIAAVVAVMIYGIVAVILRIHDRWFGGKM